MNARPSRVTVLRCAGAALLGAAAVVAYAPHAWWPVMIVALAGLAALLHGTAPRTAAAIGFAWGLGHFGVGVGWLHVALHTFGGMPTVAAAAAVALLVAYMALFPAVACGAAAAVAGGVARRGTAAGAAVTPAHAAGPSRAFAVLPATWALSEWTRMWLFTGFPWATVGYSQVPDSPLAGFAPLGGVFLVSAATVAVATAAVALVVALRTPDTPHRARVTPAVAGVAVLAVGFALTTLDWTQPTGRTLAVSLVQGNVEQSLKFSAAGLRQTVADYLDAVARSRGRLVVLPETALPIARHDIPPDLLERFAQPLRARGGDLLLGVFDNDPPGSDRWFNSVISLGTAAPQRYAKHHLVPFGEFIPLKTWLAPLVNDVLHIPLSDQTRGGADQPPLDVAGERVAVNICYEDVFGEEIVRALPDATLLVNVTNDAWYGRTWAAEQHRQIAQMRALEAGRPMLRATNTGVTAAIDARGRVIAALPQWTAGILEVTVEGRTGATPYARAGNVPVVVWAVAMVAATAWRARRPQRVRTTPAR
ncbi:MAG: apolipoprotein N-acyltransferase [Burkholderiales bacterium]|jgi:apolipoprotein N-acyltransferase|nr:apolipoprotein N-acyltransferase [Burkholderiales bacterium]